MPNPIRLEQLDHPGDLLGRSGLAGMDGQAEPELASPPEDPLVVSDAEGARLRAGDIDADHPAIPPGDRLLDENLVQLVGKGPVEAEDEARFDRVLQSGPIHPAQRRRNDVVEVLLAAPVALHRVEAQLHRGHVVLAIGAADHLVDRALDGQRAGLDELRPMKQLQVAIEALGALRDRDHVPEFPVVLGRELDPLGVGDSPHDRRGHRAAQMAVQLRQRDLA